MPNVNNSGIDPQSHGMYKWFVSTIAGIWFDGMSTFMNHKKQSALQKGAIKLQARQKAMEGKIKVLGTRKEI